MLEEATQSLKSLAWLGDTQQHQVLRIHGWREQADSRGLSFFAPDFALQTSRPWLVGEPASWPAFDKLEVLPEIRHRAEPSAADFSRLHEEVLRRIHAREFEKVVPIVCEQIEFARELNLRMFPRVFASTPNQYSYGFEFEGEALCGVTPELLFEVHDGVLKTMALAGTGGAEGPSLLDDTKERREHGLVVEHMAGELAPFGRLDVGRTVERVYGPLKHLYTPMQVELSRRPDFMEFVVKLHPTAALGGWPRKPAVEWLQRQDFHFSRRRFGAPFGYVDGDRMKCVVAIRGWQWQGPCATVASGCGVVEGSQDLREWNELKLKREVIYRNMGML